MAIRYFTFSHTLELFLEPFLGQHTPFAEIVRYQCRDHKLIGWNKTAHSERDKHELRELIGPGDRPHLHRELTSISTLRKCSAKSARFVSHTYLSNFVAIVLSA